MTANTTVVDMLKEARESVEAAELPTDLRAIGFWAAIQLRADRYPTDSTDPTDPSRARGGQAPVRAADADVLDKMAIYLGVPREAVEAVYYLDGEGPPGIGLGRSRLAKRTAEAARQLALLVAAARQFDGVEQFTAASVIRDVCQEYGVFDTGNFAKSLVAMDDVFQFQGSGAGRRVRLIRPGREQAGRLVVELAG